LKLVVGLGNPGKKYAGTRHNAGYQAIKVVADHFSFGKTENKYDALYVAGEIEGESVILAQPCSYMNKSGRVVRKFIDYYQIDVNDVIIVYDDLDLPVGKLRIRKNGSSGGHNGIKSIIYQLGSREFCRIRVGIGRPPVGLNVTEYVLGPFSRQEKKIMKQTYQDIIAVLKIICKEDYQTAMNKYN